MLVSLIKSCVTSATGLHLSEPHFPQESSEEHGPSLGPLCGSDGVWETQQGPSTRWMPALYLSGGGRPSKSTSLCPSLLIRLLLGGWLCEPCLLPWGQAQGPATVGALVGLQAGNATHTGQPASFLAAGRILGPAPAPLHGAVPHTHTGE